jgi:hypothetical protein
MARSILGLDLYGWVPERGQYGCFGSTAPRPGRSMRSSPGLTRICGNAGLASKGHFRKPPGKSRQRANADMHVSAYPVCQPVADL